MEKGLKRTCGFMSGLIGERPLAVVAFLLVLNFLVRVFIFRTTNLFRFSDFAVYLEAVSDIEAGNKVYLLNGNFLFAISYIGSFLKSLTGTPDGFFYFNSLLGSLTGLTAGLILKKLTSSWKPGIIALVIMTFYTEYMVFSSVFYTPVLMIFLVSLLILALGYYLKGGPFPGKLFYGAAAVILFLATFFFKPELKYLPFFLLIPGMAPVVRRKKIDPGLPVLALAMLASYQVFDRSGIITAPQGNVISNSFVFFGHTDYGGDGGEGAFIYPENEVRYLEALDAYCRREGITEPDKKDINRFQSEEMVKFIKSHPLKWVGIQFTKFFRTFGAVPESVSFRVLYTGLLKGRLWLTAIVVAVPVLLILILFVFLFPFGELKETLLLCRDRSPAPEQNLTKAEPAGSFKCRYAMVILIFFIYYLIATVFYGQYQERYRLPVMVLFIIPAVATFIANFDLRKLFITGHLRLKIFVVAGLIVIWSLQAVKAGGNRERIKNSMETAIKMTGPV